MNRSSCGGISLIVLLMTALPFDVHAQAQASPAPQASDSPSEAGGGSDSGDGESASSRPRRKGGKQAEGTQAPNKFEADPVLKSRYQVEGRSLEVDPD